MAKKEIPPTDGEIEEVVHDWETLDHQALQDGNFFKDRRKVVIRQKMTVLLMRHAPEEGRERIWKYCKDLTRYGHCPVKITEYERMGALCEDKVLIDTVIAAFNDTLYPYDPVKYDITDDITGYFYCISLLSQASYRREECVEILGRISSFIRYEVNDELFHNVFRRNIEMLKDRYPDLDGLQQGI